MTLGAVQTVAQRKQDDQYNFPYHHLVDYHDGLISLRKQWGWSLSYLGRIHLVLNTLNEMHFQSLLDIGCGDGKLLSILASHFADKSFVGVDYSERAIALARALSSSANVRFAVEDIAKAKTADKYDVVTLIEVIEHIPVDKLDEFARRAAERLRPGGYLICTAPSTRLAVPVKHFQHFTADRIATLWRQQGFDVHRCQEIDGENLFFTVLRKAMMNRIYVVNNRRLENFLFKMYCKLCLQGQGANGMGIFLMARKR